MSEEYECVYLPDVREQRMLEGMTPESIADYIVSLGEDGTEIERKMNKAADVLEEVHGLTVEEILKRREQNAE